MGCAFSRAKAMKYFVNSNLVQKLSFKVFRHANGAYAIENSILLALKVLLIASRSLGQV